MKPSDTTGAAAAASGYTGAMRRVSLAVSLLVAVYAAYAALLTWLQDALVFPIPGGIGRDQLDLVAAEQGARPLDLVADDGTRLYGWHRPAADDQRRALLYFHGNGETVAGNVPIQRLAQRAGFDFLTIAYRGYPGSEGHPSEEGLLRDARALWDYTTGALGIPPERIVFHGRSLGGGVATALAVDANPRAMVLESTFFSLEELAAARAPGLPVRWLFRHPFRSWERAPRVGGPVLLLHSRDDGLIPVDHARRLAERFAEVEYLETAGHGHDAVLPAVDPAMRDAWTRFVRVHVPDLPPRRQPPSPM